jgi:hypothetical protein
VREVHTTIAGKNPCVLCLRLVVSPPNRAGNPYQGKTRGKRKKPCKGIGEEKGIEQEGTTKKRMSEKTIPTDADKLPVVLHLKHADIAPPLTFICRRCGTVCRWAEPHGFDCQVATIEQQRKQVMGDDTETGKK